jgi:hypothetical protein
MDSHADYQNKPPPNNLLDVIMVSWKSGFYNGACLRLSDITAIGKDHVPVTGAVIIHRFNDLCLMYNWDRASSPIFFFEPQLFQKILDNDLANLMDWYRYDEPLNKKAWVFPIHVRDSNHFSLVVVTHPGDGEPGFVHIDTCPGLPGHCADTVHWNIMRFLTALYSRDRPFAEPPLEFSFQLRLFCFLCILQAFSIVNIVYCFICVGEG